MNPDHHSFVEIMAWGLLVLATAGAGVMLRRAIEQHSLKRAIISGVFALIALGVYFFIGHIHDQALLQNQNSKADAVDVTTLDENGIPEAKGGGEIVIQKPEPGTESAEAQPVPHGTGDAAAQQSAEAAREAAERDAQAKKLALEQVAAVKKKMEQAEKPSPLWKLNLLVLFLLYLYGGGKLIYKDPKRWKSNKLWAVIAGAFVFLVAYLYYDADSQGLVIDTTLPAVSPAPAPTVKTP